MKPAVLCLLGVGVHYAVSSLFRDYPEFISIYTHQTRRQFFEKMEVGNQKLAIGKLFLQSSITLEENTIEFCGAPLGRSKPYQWRTGVYGGRSFFGDAPGD